MNTIADSLLDPIIDRTFEIRCPVMRLVEVPSYTTVVFEGSGRFWLGSEGHMRFLLTAPLQSGGIQWEWLKRLPPSQGAFDNRPDEETLLQLRANDIDGREWIAGWLQPWQRIGSAGWVELYGRVQGLMSPRKNGKHWRSEFYVIDPPRLPFQMTTQSVSSRGGEPLSTKWSLDSQEVLLADCGWRILFESNEDRGVLRGTIEPQGEEARFIRQPTVPVMEALRFATGKPLSSAVSLEEYSDLAVWQLDGFPFQRWNSNLAPPVVPDHGESGVFWEAFRAYLRYVLADVDIYALYHPLSWNVYRVMEASLGTPESHGLAVTVAIEALAKVSRKVQRKASDLQIKPEVLRSLRRHLSTWAGDESVRTRAISISGNLKYPSAAQVLRTLVDEGVLEKRDVALWQDVRNRLAHGRVSYAEQERITGDELQHLDGVMLRMVLYEIGYDGPFTNYSDPARPLVHWGALPVTEEPPE